MALFVWQGTTLQGSSNGCQACNDGTYVYFALRDSSNNITLYKLRHSDKQIVAQVAAFNSGGYSPAVMTDGTSVLMSQHGSGIRRFLCSNLSDQGLCVSSSSLGSASEGGTFDGTYFWIGGSFATVMARITPNTWAVSTYGNNTTLGNVINVIEPAGANLMLAGGYGGGYSGMRLVNKSGTVLWDNRAVVTQSILAMAYDAVRDEIWANGDGMECVRIRGSDGVLLDRNGTPQATLPAAIIITGTYVDSKLANSFGIAVTSDTVFSSGNSTTFGVQARATAPPAYCAGQWDNITSTYRTVPGVARKFTILEKTLYGVFNGNGWSASGIMWLDFSPITPIPRITTAKANSNGIDLIFDLPVNIAATPDYGTTVANLKVNLATPTSTTEVQLLTSVSANTYEWLAAPINVTGVGVLPYVVTAYSRDNTTFVLIFSEAVVESSATNISHYAITPALDIISIVKQNATTYTMTTSPQTANTVYHVTLTGIIDPANNPI
jgi:hypothetical protein